MPTVRRALALSFLQNYATTLIQFVASVIIARLLTPGELGTFSVAMVLVALAQVLRDFGVADYIAQERDLTVERIRAAATLALVTGCALALLLVVLAWPAAIYFREPGVGKVMIVLAVSFLLIPFGTVTMAWVRRNLDFGKILVVRVSSGLVGSSTSVALAFAGASYMSMAYGLVAGSVTTIVLSLCYRPRDWPWLPSLQHMREVVSFGSWSTASAIAAQLLGSVQDVIAGRGLSLEAVGYLGRANAVLEIVFRMFTNAVYTVAAPYFAARDRGGHDLTEGYCLAVRYLTALLWPALAGISILAPEVITLLYGSQWLPSVEIARILAAGSMIYVPYLLWNAFYIGLGRVRAACMALVVMLVLRVIALVAGLPFGLLGVAYALAASALVAVVVSQVSLTREFGIRFADVARAAWPSLQVGLPTVAVALATASACRGGGMPGWATIVITAAAGTVVWLPLLRAVAHPLFEDMRHAMRRIAG